MTMRESTKSSALIGFVNEHFLYIILWWRINQPLGRGEKEGEGGKRQPMREDFFFKYLKKEGTAGLINARQELTHSTHEPVLMGFDELKGRKRETVIEKSYSTFLFYMQSSSSSPREEIKYYITLSLSLGFFCCADKKSRATGPADKSFTFLLINLSERPQ